MGESNWSQAQPPPDTLTQRIGVLTRREVEARILAPIIEALSARFDRDEVVAIVKATVVEIARQQGRELAETMGGSGSIEFMDSLDYWTRDDALQIDVLQQSEERLDFNVTRCRYAEMYQALDIPELGAVFSCNRDYALIDGFNEAAELTRTQTIMEGAPYCDFRYRFPPHPQRPPAPSFFPDAFVPPAEIRTPRLYLRPLREGDVERDYEAVMASQAQLNLWSQTTWPTPDFTLDENLADLARHAREHDERVAFTYTVLDPAGARCLGCVYINPLPDAAAPYCDGAAYGATVSFWIRSDELAGDLERHLLETLRSWFAAAWPSACLLFIVSPQNSRQAALLESAGLQERSTITLRSGFPCRSFVEVG